MHLARPTLSTRPRHFSFISHCSNRIGDAYFRTPRTTITHFVNLLAVLEQNPGTEWTALLGGLEISADTAGAADLAIDEDEDLASFKL